MRRVSFQAHGERLMARQQQLGLDAADFERARNDGRRRTPEKRALLAALEGEAVRQDRAMPVVSNY